MNKWFNECQSIEDLRKAYKELVLKNHPDRGGDNETMASINAEYDQLFNEMKLGSKNNLEQVEMPEEFRTIINKLLNLHGLKIEICGAWLWISGDTYMNKAALKACGCFWASKKMQWYWRPAEAKSFNHRPVSMDRIRAKYGSNVVAGNEQKSLVGA